MAHVLKQPHCKFWIAGITGPDGQRTYKSTRTTDRKLAQAFADKAEEAWRNRATENQFRKILSDFHERLHGTKLLSPSVSNYRETWLARKTGEIKAGTLKAYAVASKDFVTFLGKKANDSMQYLTPAVISTWRDDCAKRATPRTANNKLKSLRVMLGCAEDDGFIEENPAARVNVLRAEASTRRPFTLDELQVLFNAASQEWRGMILFGLYTGQRLKDLADLTWNNVDMAAGTLRHVTAKTDRRQKIPLAAPLREYLSALPSSDDPGAPIFPKLYGLQSSALSQQFYGVLVAAGLAKARPKSHHATGNGRSGARLKSDITFHSLRHTATSLLYAAGVPESVVMDIIGHDTKEMSEHYTHVADDAKQRAIAGMPDITGGPVKSRRSKVSV